MQFTVTKRTDERLLARMADHYSRPKGFVGRNICYAVTHNSTYYGHIVGGSATRFLPGRNEFLGITIADLNCIVANTFFNVSPPEGEKYPLRNFTSKVVRKFVSDICVDWKSKYGDAVIGFETLVEKPRSGELYRRAGWTLVGETKGYQCKRVAGRGSDSWTGKRVWNTDPKLLRPKLVFCLRCSQDEKH